MLLFNLTGYESVLSYFCLNNVLILFQLKVDKPCSIEKIYTPQMNAFVTNLFAAHLISKTSPQDNRYVYLKEQKIFKKVLLGLLKGLHLIYVYYSNIHSWSENSVSLRIFQYRTQSHRNRLSQLT